MVMKEKTYLAKPTVIFVYALLCAMILYGCSSKSSDYDVEEVMCVYNFGDMDKAELDVFTADGTVKQYIIASYSDSGVDLFHGEIPSDDKCERKESTISQEEWNHVVDTIKSSDFLTLPKELPEVEAYDGSTWYIEVKTSIGDHRSGGYCAGNGSGDKHQRFYDVKRALLDLIK